jgi:hypothetical protein
MQKLSLQPVLKERLNRCKVRDVTFWCYEGTRDPSSMTQRRQHSEEAHRTELYVEWF